MESTNKNKIEIEVIDQCTSPYTVLINGKNFNDFDNKKEFLIKFITDYIQNSEEDQLQQIFSTIMLDHPFLNESLTICEMERCDQCGDYNHYEKFTIEKNI